MLNLNQPVPQSEFGELVDIGQRRVSQLLERGIIKRGGTGREWLRQYAAHLREVAAARQSADGKLDLVAERAHLTLEHRRIAEIKRREMEGALIDKVAVGAEFAKQLGPVRDGLLNIPARLAPTLAAAGGMAEVQALLDAEIRAVLTGLVGLVD